MNNCERIAAVCNDTGGPGRTLVAARTLFEGVRKGRAEGWCHCGAHRRKTPRPIPEDGGCRSCGR